MPIRIQCPSATCRAVCTAGETAAGRSVKCPKCGRVFVATPTLDGRQGDTGRGPGAAPVPDPFPALPAEFGRYRVLRPLGRGGMGAVYLAHDTQLDRTVALKIPFFDAAGAPQRAERFVREARSAAALHHPNICTVFDAGQIDGRAFITMAYVDGPTLEAEIDPDAPMPADRAARIARAVAAALGHAHGKGIVHRDLKPGNVMLAPGGDPVVLDFGLAKRATETDPPPGAAGGEGGDARLTRDGSVLGTPGYMAPEQVRGDHAAVGPTTDVYALGAVLFEMLTGRPPYTGPIGVVLGRIVSAPVPPVGEFRPGLDPRLEAICSTALAKRPADRFPSMAAVVRALDDFLQTPARPADAEWDVEVVEPPSRGDRPPAAPPPPADGSPFADLADEPAPGPMRRTVRIGPATVADRAGRPPAAARKAWWPAAGAAAALLAVAAAVAAVLLRVETPNGMLLVEIADPAAEARVKDGKLILSGPDGKDRYTLAPGERDKAIAAGTYKIRVEGADGLALDTTEFTLKKGNRVTVRVRLDPKAAGGPAREEPPPKPGSVLTNSVGMKFTYVPAGTFSMGSPEGELGHAADEGPEHDVEISKGFYIGVFEVAQDEYEKLMGVNPSEFGGPERSRCPVERVSHDDATQFCRMLTGLAAERRLGRRYRLPTEAEWEYACRGGSPVKTAYHFGPSLSPEQANYSASGIRRPQEVGRYLPNGFGLYDMHGNVAEWCADWFASDYYRAGARRDPKGPAAGTNPVVRGGSCFSPANTVRTAYRTTYLPTAAFGDLGFRVVLDIPAGAPTNPVTVAEPDRKAAAVDPDRRAAERALSRGGTVRVNGEDRDIRDAADLPKGRFTLTYAGLHGTTATDADLPAFAGCTGLKFLNLGGLRVTDQGVAHFKNCKELTYLCLGTTRVTDVGLGPFKDCKALTTLYLDNTGVTEVGLANFKDCKALEHLHLHQTPTTDAGLAQFEGCKGLKALNLWATRVTDAGLARFKDRTELQFLNLGRTGVTDAGLAYFKDCGRLSSLYLDDTRTTDVGLSYFKGCKALTVLNVRQTGVSANGLAEFRQAVPGCKIERDDAP